MNKSEHAVLKIKILFLAIQTAPLLFTAAGTVAPPAGRPGKRWPLEMQAVRLRCEV